VSKPLDSELFSVYLFRTLGWRRGTKVAAFVAAWGIYSDSLSRSAERTLAGYASFWHESRATSFREQELFRVAFPEHLTPESLWRELRRDVSRADGDRDSATATVLAVRGSW
jgi:hypothetical protein